MSEKPRIGRELFDELFSCGEAEWLYKKFVEQFPKESESGGWAYGGRHSKLTLVTWAQMKIGPGGYHFDFQRRCVSAGNENPPTGDWITAGEHSTATLHTGSLTYYECPFGGHHEEIDPTYQSTRLPKIREKFNPTPIDTTASRVTNTKKQINHRGPQ